MKDNASVRRAKKVLTAARSALARLGGATKELRQSAELILGSKGDIIITGIGKSGFVGQKIAATLTSLGYRANFLHPVEAAHGDIGVLSKGDVLIALSFSGESKEVVRIVAYAKKNFGVPVIALTKSRRSSLGALADVAVEIKITGEGSPNDMAPMASTTATLVLGDMLSAMLVNDSFREDHFARLHPGGALGLRSKKVKEFMKVGKALPLVREDEPFSEALQEMQAKRLGAVGIVGARGKLSGIITDGDVRRALIRGLDVASAAARDVMTKNPKYIREEDSLESTLCEMEHHKITHLFVVGASGKPVGIIHIHDIVGDAFM